jgi:hypothetical protein
LWVAVVEVTKVKKDERKITINQILISLPGCQTPFKSIPGRGIVTGIEGDLEKIEEAGGDRHPFLIRREAELAFHETEIDTAPMPPFKEVIGLITFPNSKVPQVEGTKPHHRKI